jgi:hypothetical protein
LLQTKRQLKTLHSRGNMPSFAEPVAISLSVYDHLEKLEPISAEIFINL